MADLGEVSHIAGRHILRVHDTDSIIGISRRGGTRALPKTPGWRRKFKVSPAPSHDIGEFTRPAVQPYRDDG